MQYKRFTIALVTLTGFSGFTGLSGIGRQSVPVAFAFAATPSPPAATLHSETMLAWDHYVSVREAQIEDELSSKEGFLARDFLPERDRSTCQSELDTGEVCVLRMDPKRVAGVESTPKGMLHHWVGVVFVPDAELGPLLVWLQEYEQHKDRFEEVDDSSILSRDGDSFRIYLRLRRKKVVTVHYNTIHEVEYSTHSSEHASSRSVASRIAQVENAGDIDEREKTPGDDSGFLWRWHSYWRFQKVEGGVLVECESLSLSRSIPRVIRPLVSRFVDSVPRSSLRKTLHAVANYSSLHQVRDSSESRSP